MSLISPLGSLARKDRTLMMEWIDNNFFLFVVIMLVVLAGLVGLLLFLRNKREED
jgi:LPXTG-motif cell wall-anchored protein